MKPRVLALDFDGTIAVNDTVDVGAASAIQEARRAGLLAVLVTGRMLTDLAAAFCKPPLFDAIVAVVQAHLARGDFRRWIEEVFGDRELGAAILHLEREDVSNVRDTLVRVFADRYGGSST